MKHIYNKSLDVRDVMISIGHVTKSVHIKACLSFLCPQKELNRIPLTCLCGCLLACHVLEWCGVGEMQPVQSSEDNAVHPS